MPNSQASSTNSTWAPDSFNPGRPENNYVDDTDLDSCTPPDGTSSANFSSQSRFNGPMAAPTAQLRPDERFASDTSQTSNAGTAPMNIAGGTRWTGGTQNGGQ